MRADQRTWLFTPGRSLVLQRVTERNLVLPVTRVNISRIGYNPNVRYWWLRSGIVPFWEDVLERLRVQTRAEWALELLNVPISASSTTPRVVKTQLRHLSHIDCPNQTPRRIAVRGNAGKRAPRHTSSSGYIRNLASTEARVNDCDGFAYANVHILWLPMVGTCFAASGSSRISPDALDASNDNHVKEKIAVFNQPLHTRRPVMRFEERWHETGCR